MMTTKTLCLVGLLYLSSDFGCVREQPTTDQRNRDTNGGLQEALMEQLFHKLQTMNSRLQSIESHLKSFDKWKRSIEQWMKEKDKGIMCVVDYAYVRACVRARVRASIACFCEKHICSI